MWKYILYILIYSYMYYVYIYIYIYNIQTYIEKTLTV